MIKAAVLLGANEEEASKEMAEVMELMGNLVNLTKKHLNFYDILPWLNTSKSQDPNALNKVGDLSETFPEVRRHHFVTLSNTKQTLF